MGFVLLSAALAAAEPCYGLEGEHRVESEHFWITWDGDVIDEDQAELLAENAELGRETWLAMGYGFTDEPIRVDVTTLGGDGVSGLTTTRDCDGVPVPHVQLWIASWSDDAAGDVMVHETAHAAQYADMGAYTDSVNAWLWFMEGHATWLTAVARGDWAGWRWSAQRYVDHLELPLEHWLEGFLDGTSQDHMYGTTLMVAAFADRFGPEAVRDLWTWGGPRTGARLFFPDAVTGIGEDFHAFWASYLARLPQLDVPNADGMDLPRLGAEDLGAGSSAGAGGLGVAFARWRPGTTPANRSFELSFEGADLPWSVVLAAYSRRGALLEWAPIEVAAGVGSGWISYGGDDVEIVLVASPVTQDRAAVPFSWRASLGDVRDPMTSATVDRPAPTIEAVEDPTCGCRQGPFGLGWLVVTALAMTRRQKLPRGAAGGRDVG